MIQNAAIKYEEINGVRERNPAIGRLDREAVSSFPGLCPCSPSFHGPRKPAASLPEELHPLGVGLRGSVSNLKFQGEFGIGWLAAAHITNEPINQSVQGNVAADPKI